MMANCDIAVSGVTLKRRVLIAVKDDLDGKTLGGPVSAGTGVDNMMITGRPVED